MFGCRVPLGLGVWDIALDTNKQRLYWTNGQELYQSDVSLDTPENFQILAPHAISPAPIALAVAPEGSLLWLDAEDEVLRMLPFDKDTEKFGKPKDLYPAPNPTRGLAVCSLADDQNSGKEAAFVYWVAAERRTLEVPVLDTPGRYIDLYYEPERNKEYCQHVDMVAVDEITGAYWQDANWVMYTLGGENTSYGPFSLSPGFAIDAKIRLDASNPPDSADSAIITIDLGIGLDEELIQIRRNGLHFSFADDSAWTFPEDQWFDLRVEIHAKLMVTVFVNGQQVFQRGDLWQWNEHTVVDNSIPEATVYIPAIRYEPGYAKGEIYQVQVVSLDKPETILAQRTAISHDGAVNIDPNPNPNKLVAGTLDNGAQTKILTLLNPDDVLAFEPIRLDLHQGWTACAELIWDGEPSGSTAPVCLYELATFEGDDRLVCGIEPDGLPKLYLRWEGHLLTKEDGETKSSKRIAAGSQQRVTWTLSANGRATTYIDEEAVWEMQINGPGGVKVFESHRLGAPNTDQTHAEVKGALLNDTDDAQTIFTGFTGKIIRFGAWNSYVPKAAEGWDQTPGPDPTWARSLVTVESKRRYLHAGRLDGLEPSVTLFPLDMDGGLSIETSLDQAHADLTHAHNQQAAAEAYAAQLKEAALQDAHDKAAAATKHLADTQTKATADTAAAQEKANTDKAAESKHKADADAQAERDRVTGADQAKATREKGKQKAETQESRAADDKKDKIGKANSQLSKKRQDRDAKQAEYDEKR